MGFEFPFGVVKKFQNQIVAGLYNIVSILNTTALYTLKWFLLYCVNFSSTKLSFKKFTFPVIGWNNPTTISLLFVIENRVCCKRIVRRSLNYSNQFFPTVTKVKSEIVADSPENCSLSALIRKKKNSKKKDLAVGKNRVWEREDLRNVHNNEETKHEIKLETQEGNQPQRTCLVYKNVYKEVDKCTK